MIERYRGKSENKVSALDGNDNGHYNSKTLTNQYIIKGMASGKSKEAMRRNTDTQEGGDGNNSSPEPNEPVRETQLNSRVSNVHPFDSNNQINNDLRNQLSEQSLNQNQISSQDFNRIVI